MWYRLGNHFFLRVILLLVFSWVGTHGMSFDLSRHPLKSLELPLFLSPQGSPDAVVRCGLVKIEYQRKGFFRIGAFPQLVFEDLAIEVVKNEKVEEVIPAFLQKFQQENKDATFLVRRADFRLEAGQVRLKVDQIKANDSGKWSLKDIYWQRGPEIISAGEGTLQIVGPEAGLLVLRTAEGPKHFSLFNSQLPKTQTTHNP